ncbi:ATP-binding protein [Niabella ginsengisoli]|uniref:AAA family ATPase n=1 Tax=Niabella ginsengisoli TaxID=522298 RepID=A0ABS9SEW7_9BACT|nr:ATP-binding protein [Niabella ginsengisoli]MCH5596898.1 AAA family ATPase [Niabella ginsengisoli]
MREQAAVYMQQAEEKVNKLLFDVRTSKKETLPDYVMLLNQLRMLRGEIVGLKKTAYTDVASLEKHEKTLAEKTDELSKACVQFLLKDDALDIYKAQIIQLQNALPQAAKVIEVKDLEKQSAEIAGALEMLIEIVNQLKIEDTSHTTQIIENISQLFSQLNQLRTQLQNRRSELNKKESEAEFQAQMTLLDQSVINFLDMADTPEKANDYLSKLTIQLEEIEMRFAEWDAVQEKTAEKRQAIYDSFEARKVQLTEQKNRKSGQLLQAAERIITGAKNKVKNLKSDTEINAFFSSDIMIDRARQIAQELMNMEDAAKSEEIQQQLLVIQQEAIRNLKDRKELYVDGDQVLSMGKYRFAIQSQNLALSLTYKDDGYCYHITGTSYFEPVSNAGLTALQDVFEQEYVSENDDIPRAVYFAWRILQQQKFGKLPTDEVLEKSVREYLVTHPLEGYVKGVHDNDAFTLAKQWLQLQKDLGVLKYQPTERAYTHIFWHYLSAKEKDDFTKQISAVKFLKDHYHQQKEIELFIKDAANHLDNFLQNNFPEVIIDAKEAASYLYNKTTGVINITKHNHKIYTGFKEHLKADFIDKKYDEYMRELQAEPAMLWALVESWLLRFAKTKEHELSAGVITELTALLIVEAKKKIEVENVADEIEIKALQSINTTDNPFVLNHYKWATLLKHFDAVLVPQFNQLQQLKRNLLQEKNKELRLDNFKTEVLTSFVRNQLINQVYFPIIGSNFSKQIGEAGDAKRSDRSGLLLLVSPPGYGKTTLMEYVADRLGLVFIKINAPSLGHSITSVDPNEAKDAAAKSELRKLNLAFEMGDNVMLYIDDIQHCHPEFLQKFISLADGQRRMDGVFNGASKTYDLRGKRFALVMAGNPYTESGEVFKIPDMLANRADIYNLGDMTANNKASFEMSMLENALTSNPYLRKLTQSGTENLYKLVAYAQDPESNLPNLEGNFSASEIQDFIKVVKHALQARAVVLRVNENYIKSAGIVDAFREEPPFKLQGSYRNMNKILANVQPIMNADEITELLINHYNNESQTLTQDAEANLLKLREIMGLLTPEQEKRWADIKVQFKKYRMLKGLPDQDKFAQILHK